MGLLYSKNNRNTQEAGATFSYWFLLSFHYDRRTYSAWCNSFSFGEACFMSQDMVYLGILSASAWKEHVFYSCCVEYSINPDGWWWNLLSICSINCRERGVEFSKYNCGFVSFSFHLSEFLHHIVWSSVVSCTNIQNCYVNFVEWPFHHYKMSLSLWLFYLLWSLLYLILI